MKLMEATKTVLITMNKCRLGLEGEFEEAELPLLVRRAGMAEWDDGVVRILDRRALPLSEKYVECRTTEEVAIAIEEMVIQGAFSLSIAAGYGLALSGGDGPDGLEGIRAAAARLIRTRPTGLALQRMMDECLKRAQAAIACGENAVDSILATVDSAAATLLDRDGKRVNGRRNSWRMARAS